MKTFLKNFAVGVPLALGAVLTLVGVSMIVRDSSSDDVLVGAITCLLGVPLLFATLSSVLRSRAAI